MASSSINPVLAAKANLNLLFKDVGKNISPFDANQSPLVDAGQKNTADVAARFLIAEQGRSFWNKQYDVVKKEAKEAGILGEESDYVEGETCVVSSYKGFNITARKAAGSMYIDRTALLNALNKHVPRAKADLVLAECDKERKGAVTIAVSVL